MVLFFSKRKLTETKIRLFVLAMLFLILFPMRTLITPADHDGYLKLMNEASSVVSDGNLTSKQNVGRFYALVESLFPYWVFTNGIFFIYLFSITRTTKTASSFLLVLITALPMFIHFNYISKEGILGLIAITSLYSTKIIGKKAGYFLFFLCIVFFATKIRPYYAIPIAATLSLICFGDKKGLWVIIFIGLISFLFYPIPFELLEVNRHQMYLMSIVKHGTRTVYPGIILDSAIELHYRSIINYLVVSINSIFPLVWTFTLKDVFAQLFILSMLVLIIKAFKYGDKVFVRFGVFLTLTIPFFSPDLGTTIRHVSAAAMFLHIGVLVNLDLKTSQGTLRCFQISPLYLIKKTNE